MEVTPPSEFFLLGSTIRRVSDIRALQLDGGLSGHGCWGEIWLTTEDEPRMIGDGSYEGCPRHVVHEVVRKSDGTPDFGFRLFRKKMQHLLS